MSYLIVRLEITSSNGAEDAKDRLDGQSSYEEIQVTIGGVAYDAEVIDYETREVRSHG